MESFAQLCNTLNHLQSSGNTSTNALDMVDSLVPDAREHRQRKKRKRNGNGKKRAGNNGGGNRPLLNKRVPLPQVHLTASSTFPASASAMSTPNYLLLDGGGSTLSVLNASNGDGGGRQQQQQQQWRGGGGPGSRVLQQQQSSFVDDGSNALALFEDSADFTTTGNGSSTLRKSQRKTKKTASVTSPTQAPTAAASNTTSKQRRRDEMDYLHKVVVQQASDLYASLAAVETEPSFSLKPPLPAIQRNRPEEEEEAWSEEVATLLGVPGGMGAPPSPFFLSPNRQFRRFAEEELANGVPAFLAIDEEMEEEERRRGDGEDGEPGRTATSPRAGLGTTAAGFNGRTVSMFAASGPSKVTSTSVVRPERPREHEARDRPGVSLLETMAREQEDDEKGGDDNFSLLSSASVVGEDVVSSHVETTSGIMTTVTTTLSVTNDDVEGGRMMFLDNNSVVRTIFFPLPCQILTSNSHSRFSLSLSLSLSPSRSLQVPGPSQESTHLVEAERGTILSLADGSTFYTQRERERKHRHRGHGGHPGHSPPRGGDVDDQGLRHSLDGGSGHLADGQPSGPPSRPPSRPLTGTSEWRKAKTETLISHLERTNDIEYHDQHENEGRLDGKTFYFVLSCFFLSSSSSSSSQNIFFLSSSSLLLFLNRPLTTTPVPPILFFFSPKNRRNERSSA